MLKKTKKLILVLLISAFTFTLLFAASSFYKTKFVKEPMATFLEDSQLITEYEIVTKEKSQLLNLHLKHTNNLAGEFQSFLNDSSEIFNKDTLTIQVYSNPNQKLLDFYQNIHPAVYEALASGNYTTLQDRLQTKGERYMLTKAAITINQDFLFLQLEDQDNYLYYIYNRNENIFPKVINNLGSDLL